MKSLQTILIALVLLVLAFLLGYCTGQKNCQDHLTVRTDTVIKSRTDTVFLDKKGEKKFDKPKPVTTQAPKQNPPGVVVDDSIRAYVNWLSDSLVDITVEDTVAGRLLGSRIKYTSRIPTITNTDSVFVTRNIVLNPMRLYIESFASLNRQNPGFGLGLNLSLKKQNYRVGYDLLRKEYSCGVGIKLF